MGKKSQLKAHKIREPHIEYETLLTYMDRIKTNTQQDMALFPHRSELLFDYFFSLGYYLVMEEESYSDFMMPDFAKQVVGDLKKAQEMMDGKRKPSKIEWRN